MLFIATVVAGGFLVLRWPRLAWVHLPVLAWGFTVSVTGWICPLTPLEQQLRLAAGEASYSGGFIEHYLVPLIYPEGLTEATRWIHAAVIVAVNVAVYLLLLRKSRRTSA